MTTLAIADGQVLVRTAKTLFCFVNPMIEKANQGERLLSVAGCKVRIREFRQHGLFWMEAS